MENSLTLIHRLVCVAAARNVQGTPLVAVPALQLACTGTATQNRGSSTVFLSMWPIMSPWGDLIY